MKKVLIALALVAASTAPALADYGKEPTIPGHKASVKSHSESRGKQGEVGGSQASDPYWEPCHFSRYGGENTCD